MVSFKKSILVGGRFGEGGVGGQEKASNALREKSICESSQK